MASGWLEAGMPDEARRALVALKGRRPKSPLTVGGRQVAWFEADADAVAWLTRLIGPQWTVKAGAADRWLMFRGDAARNVAAAGSAPLFSLCWRIPTLTDLERPSAADERMRQLRQIYQEQGSVILSGLHPLVVDDVVLMRDVRTLWAIDFETGKRRWYVPADDPLEALSKRDGNNDPWQQVTMLAPRLWEDGTYGTLSSDGRCVFSIEDVALENDNNGNMPFGWGGMGRGSNANQGPCNRLAAHDIRNGKLIWQIGGLPAALALRQAGSIFLGPPLPLRGQLYVLAEVNDEIRLLALDAGNGNTLWSQQLAVVQHNFAPDSLRRNVGVSPSYADGILICPTGTGGVVALDLATHSLRWGYSYSHGQNAMEVRQRMMMGRFGGYYMNGTPTARWADGTATIVDGRVLVTAAEADALFALSLIDGTPLWDPLPRQDDLYVACVHAGKIVLVGRRGIHAVNLSDGKAAWKGRTVAFPDGGAPSGLGFRTGNRYYVPLSSAEVAVVDLDAGKIVQTSKSHDGEIPGNLVCYKDKVISQGWEGVEVFFQADALRDELQRRLAAKPDDAEALRLQGEVFLQGDNCTRPSRASTARTSWSRTRGRGSCCENRS